MTVGDNTTQAKGSGDFFENLGKKGLNLSKKNGEKCFKNPSRSLEDTANIATAAASRNPKNVTSTLSEVINFYHTGNAL